ncbi:formate dehydrogenase subunit alpha [Spectribacter hydrogenoxidans]|uniref:Formate dehydrogenase subunit alpha n=1 Tax=Spectribacter hydrogenoxidans TaxID=3075608 RepID=A0ABU3C439_9GAMM|nr:formate dehydrogenase subunit alpha [Salinisphaera sp. W335]MDT0636333.1 formate dehydrogenase subunit alpha [Salinisphaera sp. W335]
MSTQLKPTDFGTPASHSDQQVTLEIDGQSVTVPEGTSVMRAALESGIDVPKLCASDNLEPFGSCRLCLVEVEGKRGYPASCTMPVAEGMEVRTQSDKLNELRRGVVELYLSDHPGQSVTPDGHGDDELLQLADQLGVTEVRYGRDGANHQDVEPDASNPYFRFDSSRCIVCSRCVRACNEVQGTFALTVDGRGFASMISAGTDSDDFLNSECVSCGACVQACPTEALLEKDVIELGMPERAVTTTCAYCGVGCSFQAEMKGDDVVRMVPYKEGKANHGHSCVKGRFAWGYTQHPDRITSPMIREKITDPWREVSWDEAYDFTVQRIRAISDEYGRAALGAITSSRCTNEETYLVQKLARAVFGTNNVDTCARVCHSPTGYGLKTTLGTSAGTQDFDSVEESDVMLVIGANPTDAHPVFASQMKRRLRAGARLIVADPRAIDLVRSAHVEADHHLQLKPGTNVPLINALAHTVLDEGLADEDFVRDRCEVDEYAEWRDFILRPENSPETVAEITGVSAADIRAAARLYATGGNAAIYYGLGVTEHSQGSTMVMGMANLAMCTGNIGRNGVGVNPLRGQNNVQGSCDMGSFPHELPGYRHISRQDVRDIYEKEWGVTLDTEPGLRIPNMIDAATGGTFKALYVQGEDILQSDPNIKHIAAGLSAMECVIVQDLFLNETASYAHVFLPGSSFLEKDGTFTNAERRINRVRKVQEPPAGKADWEITQDLAQKLGYPMHYNHPSEIMDEVARTTPTFQGVSFERLDQLGSIQWPCNEEYPEGTPVMHIGEFVRGKGKFMLTPYVATDERANRKFPLLLTTGRILSQYNVGAQTRRTENRVWHGEDWLELHPSDAETRGIRDGTLVAVASRMGETTLRAIVSERMMPGVVYTTFHFPETAANVITTEYSDWATECPEYKVTAVEVRPCNTMSEWQKRYLDDRENQQRIAEPETEKA